MPTDGVFLADFGLAKNTATGSRYTRTGQTLGTPSYMSPELARGEIGELTPAGDVWALGCVLYELLAGRRAFEGETAAAIVAAILYNAPAPAAGVPAGVADLVAVSLQRPPEDRPANAGELARECERVLQGQRTRRRPRRRVAGPLLIAGAVAAAALLVAGAIWAGAAGAGSPPPGATAPEARAAADADAAWADRLRDPAAALRRLEPLLAAYPERHAWRVRLGSLRWVTGDTSGARAEWERVPPGAIEYTRAWWLHGLCTRAQAIESDDDSAIARSELSWQRAAAGSGPEAAWARAGLHLGRGEFAAARKLLDGTTEWDPALLLGICEIRSATVAGDVRAIVARRAFDRALETGLRFPFALHCRATLKSEGGDYQGALEDCNESLRLGGRRAQTLLNRALVYQKLDRLTEAARDLDEALALHPNSPDILEQRALCRWRAGDRLRAMADLDRVIAAVPSHAGARYHRGRWRFIARDVPGAITDWVVAAEQRPELVEVWVNLGVARRLLGDLEGAERDLTRALELDPAHTNGLLERGNIALARRRHAAARRDFERVIAADSEEVRAYVNLAVVCRRERDYAAALGHLDRALGIDPGHLLGRANRGHTYAAAGRLAEAQADLERCLKQAPLAWEHRAFYSDLLERVKKMR